MVVVVVQVLVDDDDEHMSGGDNDKDGDDIDDDDDDGFVDWDDRQKIEMCPTDTSVFGDLNVRFVRGAISYLLEAGATIYMFVKVRPSSDLGLISAYLASSTSSFNQMFRSQSFIAVVPFTLILAHQSKRPSLRRQQLSERGEEQVYAMSDIWWETILCDQLLVQL